MELKGHIYVDCYLKCTAYHYSQADPHTVFWYMVFDI